jgi:hypothetical protein
MMKTRECFEEMERNGDSNSSDINSQPKWSILTRLTFPGCVNFYDYDRCCDRGGAAVPTQIGHPGVMVCIALRATNAAPCRAQARM